MRVRGWPSAPDSYDGVGFVESVITFDIGALKPHPPGYPLFVALCRLAHLFGLSPLHAVVATSLVTGAIVLPVAAFVLVRRAFGGELGAFFAAFLLACAPGFVVAGAGTWSDGAGLAFAVAAYAMALGRRPATPLYTGFLVAACIGVRPSGMMMVLPALLVVSHGTRLARHRARAVLEAIAATALGIVAWAVPMVLHFGAARWWELSHAQLSSHLARWGESDAAWTQGRSAPRAIAESISLQLFGVEGLDASIAVGVALAVLLLVALRSAPNRRALLPLAAVLPYALLDACYQPIAAAPRHALPITAALVVSLGALIAAAEKEPRPRAHEPLPLLAIAALAIWIAFRGVAAATTHALPPPAVAMLRFVAHEPSLANAAVVAGRSSRFAEYGDGARVAPGELAGDAIIFATRADVLPAPLLVTSEIDLTGVDPSRLTEVATFTRTSPLDRRERTLTLYKLDINLTP